MKVHFFHLMPWPDLPQDFAQKYRSVWVDVPSQLYDPARGHEVYNEYLDELEYAAALGFDGVCVNEHHSNAYGLMPSPNLMAAAMARRTRDAALIVLGNSIALYNPPIRVAEEFAMLDVMSGGRLVAGFPVGTSMDTTFAYGNPPITLRDRYYEAHDLITRAWTDPDVFHFNGKFTKLRYVNTWPKPVQKPHPPVWIPGGGSIETWAWCAEKDYMYCYLSYFGHLRAQAVMDKFWAEIDKHGLERNPYRAGFLQFVAVSETDEQAEKDYAEAAEYFYNRCLHIATGFADAPGYRTLATVKAGMLAQVGATAQAIRSELKWKDFVEQGYIVAGSPATVRQKLEEVSKSLNIGHMMTLLQFGNMNKETVTKNTTLFAHEVLPHLRSLHGEWEDRWWINPLPADQRVEPNPATLAQPTGVK
jgi:alkanesulfonate monooxygenase SsuD/methylene tetrahydromethanopterin reductase-like flavin-dependent oxidoreductase (luciferase family)